MNRLARGAADHVKKVVGGAALLGGGFTFMMWEDGRGLGENAPYNRFERFGVAVVETLKESVVPPREDVIANTKAGKPYDVLVIGGGATGAGVALDAATRGLKVALVEREDFASGTSSRSTKLIHGGVRYLEKAVFNLDYGQLKLVFEALNERGQMMRTAPHLTNALPILTPCYKWYELPYYWAGLRAYDFIAGKQKLYSTSWVSAGETLRKFPHLPKQNLSGSVVYYDGQMNDSRLNVTIALTAAARGADVLNYTEVVDLHSDTDGKVCGARVKDVLTNEEFDIKAKAVVNAGGPFVDGVRKMDNPNAEAMVTPSSGVHIILPEYYSPEQMGMIVPKTKDGRVVFMLPWLGQTICGTTDTPTEVEKFPKASQQEVDFILEAISEFLTVKVRRSDVKAAWSGIRPLANDPEKKDTSDLSRDHVISVAPSGLVTISGGKWTTYRLMAEDTLDKAIQVSGLRPKMKCQTANSNFLLIGAENWDPAFYTVLTQDYIRRKDRAQKSRFHGKMTSEIAKHLSMSYGTRAIAVAELAHHGWGKKLVHEYPILEAEIIYAVHNEYCCTVVDFLARRTRLAFLDTEAAKRAIPRTAELMAEELKWTKQRKQEEIKNAEDFISTMNVLRPKPVKKY